MRYTNFAVLIGQGKPQCFGRKMNVDSDGINKQGIVQEAKVLVRGSSQYTEYVRTPVSN